MNEHMMNMKGYIRFVRRPIRQVVDYCYGDETEDKDKIGERKIKAHVDVIDKCGELLELYTDVINTKTDNDILEYFRDSGIDILSNVRADTNDRTKKNIKLAFDISRIVASYHKAREGDDDESSIKIIRSLWGDWATPFADVYMVISEFDELLTRLNNTDDASRISIAEVLIDIDIKILEHLNHEIKCNMNQFGKTL